MIKIDKNLIDNLSRQAVRSERKRKNLNFHKVPEDTLHRMLNAMEPGTYLQPHKHENPDKREAFIVLKGRVLVIEFNNSGQISESIILDPATENFGAEISPGSWHSLLVLTKGTVIYEVKDGPYDVATDKIFAPWAPREGDAECQAYNNRILESLGLTGEN
ncbi:MAG: WbuC family cupin fold metalloprotein [Bacteroidales bacterium]|nr:WbuC family cupin fold metalloprotein [Bacteroidales bacterium]